MNENHLVAPVVPQHPDQAVIEAAGFHDSDELLFAPGTPPCELIKELQHLVGTGGNLPRQEDITRLVTQ